MTFDWNPRAGEKVRSKQALSNPNMGPPIEDGKHPIADQHTEGVQEQVIHVENTYVERSFHPFNDQPGADRKNQGSPEQVRAK